MADCSDEFLEFNTAISLNKTNKLQLRNARKAIMKKTEIYFDQNSLPNIEFKTQGSFSMDTIIKPLRGDYDIDIGVYLKDQSKFRNDWPKPETISKWLINALHNHTSISPINKRACIRIQYKPINYIKDISYHIDLPVYIEYINFWGNKKTRIGLIGEEQWEQKSNPVGFTKWFMEKCKKNESDKNQLIRIVKYLKAWKDFVGKESKFPSGMALTILLANNYFPHTREDIAFQETIRRSYNALSWLFGLEIYSPVETFNDVASKLNSKQKKYFKEKFEQLVDDAKDAIKEKDKNVSIQIWRNQFGERIK